MTTLKDYQKYAQLYLDKYANTMLILDKRHLTRNADGTSVCPARHTLDLTDAWNNLDKTTAAYIVTMETMCVELIRELFKEKGLTATDDDIIKKLNAGGITKFQRTLKA